MTKTRRALPFGATGTDAEGVIPQSHPQSERQEGELGAATAQGGFFSVRSVGWNLNHCNWCIARGVTLPTAGHPLEGNVLIGSAVTD